MEVLTEHLRNGLFLGLGISLPVILTAASVGLVVGILQAVTQVQEQTIAAAPKITLVFLVVILGGNLMLSMFNTYLRETVALAFNEIPKMDPLVLPPAPRR